MHLSGTKKVKVIRCFKVCFYDNRMVFVGLNQNKLQCHVHVSKETCHSVKGCDSLMCI